MPKHELLKIDTLSIIVRDSRIKAKSYHHKIRLKNIFYLFFFYLINHSYTVRTIIFSPEHVRWLLQQMLRQL